MRGWFSCNGLQLPKLTGLGSACAVDQFRRGGGGQEGRKGADACLAACALSLMVHWWMLGESWGCD